MEGRSPDSTRPLREGDSRRAGTLLTVPLRRSGLTGSESVETQRGAQVGGQGPGMGAELAGARRPGVEPPSSRSRGPGEGARSLYPSPAPGASGLWIAVEPGPLSFVCAPPPSPSAPSRVLQLPLNLGSLQGNLECAKEDRMPWGPEDPKDCSPSEIPTPGPDVQDRASSPTHPGLSFPPCVYWRGGGPPCWPQML